MGENAPRCHTRLTTALHSSAGSGLCSYKKNISEAVGAAASDSDVPYGRSAAALVQRKSTAPAQRQVRIVFSVIPPLSKTEGTNLMNFL